METSKKIIVSLLTCLLPLQSLALQKIEQKSVQTTSNAFIGLGLAMIALPVACYTYLKGNQLYHNRNEKKAQKASQDCVKYYNNTLFNQVTWRQADEDAANRRIAHFDELFAQTVQEQELAAQKRAAFYQPAMKRALWVSGLCGVGFVVGGLCCFNAKS